MEIWIVSDADSEYKYYFSSFEKAQHFISTYYVNYEIIDNYVNSKKTFYEYSVKDPEDLFTFIVNLYSYKLDSEVGD